MAVSRTKGKTRSHETPSLFDSPRRAPIVRIAGVDPTFIPDATGATDDDPPARSIRTPTAREGPADADVVEARPHADLNPPISSNHNAPRPPSKPTARQLVTAEALATKQRDISVSEFFAKNRHLLGFDNKRKALLTTVKEAVDNSLDACEEAGILPDIVVAIDQLAEDRFRVTVCDNGPGIVKAQIPNIFGKLLYGSKFHRLKMSRGQQGIGISAAGMYGLLTTGKPIHITSRTGANKPAHHFQIAIDTSKNRPDVVKDEEQEAAWERGTQVSIELSATYAKGRQSVDEYIEQTAIANPHARIEFRAPPPGGAGVSPVREFPRGSDDLPPETREIQPHPHGIELGVLMKMLKDSRPTKRGQRSPTLSSFLQENFSRVTTRVAHEICQAAKLNPKVKPADLPAHDVEKLYQAMQSVKIMAPPTDCLAPIGVRALLAGLLKEVKAEFFTATTRDPAVYRGNPFLIEVGLAFGGTLSNEETSRIIRFANRVPLLYQQSACAAFKSVLDVDWRNYGLSQPGGSAPVGPLVVMLHMASVWVPFTSESKEAIADYDEIRKEIKLALQECGRKLGAYVRRRKRQRLEGERRSIFERYIEDVAEALSALTGDNADKLKKDLQSIARRRTADADVELDEEGRPVKKAEGDAAAGAAPGGRASAASDADELSGDESTVIVEANVAPPPDEHPAGDLFADGDSSSGRKRKRRPRGE